MASKSKKILNFIDGIRAWNLSSSQTSSTKNNVEIEETLRSEHFQIGKIVRHGFPHEATCVAFDPIQRILAIGTKSGSIRLFGRPGVECHLKHSSPAAVVQILFLVNDGTLISICGDDTVHMWSIKQKQPEIVRSSQFKRERLTCGHLALGSAWLYLGTEKGNIYFINVQTFATSGYVINWNKAIDLCQTTHPGSVVQLADNPQDPNKLLIGFSTGFIALWDLRSKSAEMRFKHPDALWGICWHQEGKLFMTCHSGGLLATWSYRQPQKPVSILYPHGGREVQPEDHPTTLGTAFEPIKRVEWLSTKSGEPFVIFAGGSPIPPSGVSHPPSVTVMRGKRLSVMQMDYPVLDFISCCESPYANDVAEPYAVVVLLQNDLVLIDLLSPNYPSFENPYPMDLHESPVTSLTYLSDCPSDLVPAFYTVGSRAKQQRSQAAAAAGADGYSQREWPIAGGEWGTNMCSYAEMVITGHADGTVRFWDASAVTLTALYKVRTSKFFERGGTVSAPDPAGGSGGEGVNQSEQMLNGHVIPLVEEHPFAVHLLNFCADSRKLVAAGTTHVTVLSFNRREIVSDIPTVDVNIVYEVVDDYEGCEESQRPTLPPPPPTTLPHQSGSVGSYSSSMSHADKDLRVFIPVRPGTRKWSPGYQPELICRLGSNDGHPPPPITAVSLNSSYGLLAFGNDYGIAIVDVVQKTCLLSTGTPDLYGSLDPYTRVARSPGASKNKEDIKCPPVDQEVGALQFVLADLGQAASPTPCIPTHNKKTALRTSDPPDSAVELGIDIVNELYQSDLEIGKQKRPSPPARPPPPRPPPPRPPPPQSPPLQSPPPQSPPLQSPPLQSPPPRSLLAPKSGETKGPTVTRPDRRRSSEADNGCSSSVLNLFKPGNHHSNKKGGGVICSPNKFTIVDLRRETGGSQWQKIATSKLWSISPLAARVVLTLKQRAEKSELGHFSRSCSSSTSSLDQISCEAIRCLVFADSYSRKQDNQTMPCLWIGTSLGSALVINIHLPESRTTQPVIVSPSGTIFRLRGEILCMSFLDCSGDLIPAQAERWEDSQRPNTLANAAAAGSGGVPAPLTASGASAPVGPATTPAATNGAAGGSTDRGGGPTSGGDVPAPLTTNPSCDLAGGSTPPPSAPPAAAKRLGGKREAFLGGKQTTISSSTSSTTTLSGIAGPSVSSTAGSGAGASGAQQQQPPQPQQAESPTGSGCHEGDRQFAVLCSEKHVRVVALPSQICAFKAKITETSCVVKADIVRLRSSPFLAVYLANGHFMAFSLPSLRVLLDVDYLPLGERVARTLCFGHNGHVVYFCSPTEMEKLTMSAEMCTNLREMHGDIYLTSCTIPEAPKKNFFQNLFSGATSPLDRDELFGDAAGKASTATSTVLSNPKMDRLNAQAGGATSAIAKARLAAIERGERLGQLDQQTQEMLDQAKAFSKNANLLASKYEKKDKRWGWPR